MRRYFFVLIILIYACDTGDLKVIMDLPIELNEVSGLAVSDDTKLFWMVNDSGNKAILYGLNRNGEIIKTLKIDADNNDWEDLTTDPRGNIYIGDFGNNDNDRKNLSILKIHRDSLKTKTNSVIPEYISFTYPEQKKFPPKKDKRHFDCEAFFFYQDSLYLFTKSRSPNHPEKTNLYTLPAQKGIYEANFVDTFDTCKDDECWITSADINKKGDRIALLTENSVFLFTELNKADFLSSKFKRYQFEYKSQKESVVFKNDSTLYIADEYLGVDGGNVYEFDLD